MDSPVDIEADLMMDTARGLRAGLEVDAAADLGTDWGLHLVVSLLLQAVAALALAGEVEM